MCNKSLSSRSPDGDRKKFLVRRRQSPWLPDDLADWWNVPAQRWRCPWLPDDFNGLHLMVCRADIHHVSPHRCPPANTLHIATRTPLRPQTMRWCNPQLYVIEMFPSRRTTACWNSRINQQLLGPEVFHSSGSPEAHRWSSTVLASRIQYKRLYLNC